MLETDETVKVEQARLLAQRAQGHGGAPQDAIADYDAALALLDGLPPLQLLADVLRWKGSALRDRGDTDPAEELYDRSMAVARSIDYPGGIAHALNCQGTLAQRRGEIALADAMFEHAAIIAGHVGDRRLIGMVEINRGITADMRDDVECATSHLERALDIMMAAGDCAGMCWALNNAALVHGRHGTPDEGLALLERGLLMARESGDLMAEGIIEQNRGELLLGDGRAAEARTAVNRALAIADQRGDHFRRADALRLLAHIERLEGTPVHQHLEDALTLNGQAQDALLASEIYSELAESCMQDGEVERASDWWAKAVDVLRRLGSDQRLARARSRFSLARH